MSRSANIILAQGAKFNRLTLKKGKNVRVCIGNTFVVTYVYDGIEGVRSFFDSEASAITFAASCSGVVTTEQIFGNKFIAG